MEHLSPESRDWFIAATDPFHDFERPLAGLPDQFVGRTVVECVTKQYSVFAPEGSVGLWNCHVYNTPFSSTLMNSSTIHANPGTIPYIVDAPRATNIPFGPVMWNTCGVDEPSIAGQLGVYTFASTYLDAYKAESVRLIALGFEVTNTTADLTRQGTVTVYKQPQVMKNLDLYLDPITQWQTNIKLYNMPPIIVGQAFSIPGSKTWKAADGCYVPCILQTDRADFVYDTANRIAMAQQSLLFNDAPMGPIYYHNNCWPTTNTFDTLRGHHTNAFDNSGAYFTGLSPSTTLTITVKYYLELAPNAGSPFLYLSTPSPVSDPRVLELYDETMRSMPPGVRKNDNDAGDFFKSLLGAVANAILPGSSLVTDFAVSKISDSVKRRKEKKALVKNEQKPAKGKPISVAGGKKK